MSSLLHHLRPLALAAFCALSPLASNASATAHTSEQAQLNGPQVLLLTSGQIYEGEARGVRDGSLVFVRSSSSGEAEYRFSADEIERIDFPGTSIENQATQLLAEQNFKQALPLLECLYRQRGAYLEFLPDADRKLFLKMAEAERTDGDPYAAVGIARRLRMVTSDPVLRQRLDDLILLSYYRLPLISDTRELAQAWIAGHQRYSSSALGWYVLARLELDAGQYEQALTTALNPVTFSSQYPMAYLAHCYAIAILAADALGEPDEARTLAAEMRTRQLAWPRDEGLRDHKPWYEQLLTPAETTDNDNKKSGLTPTRQYD